MEKRKNVDELFGQIGKLLLDLAKIIFGGVVIAGIMQDNALARSGILRTFAIVTVIIFVVAGLMFYYYKERIAK